MSKQKSSKSKGRRKLSLSNEDSTVISVRVPRSWVKALRRLETEEVKQQMLVRRAIRGFLEENKALKPEGAKPEAKPDAVSEPEPDAPSPSV